MDRRTDHLTCSDGASAPKIGGSLSPPSPPPVRRHDAPETPRPPPRHGCRSRRGESVPNRFQQGFPGKAPTIAARAPPSESADLSLPDACATYRSHPPFVSGACVRRHHLDPRRRKSSIISRPLEVAITFDAVPIGISLGPTSVCLSSAGIQGQLLAPGHPASLLVQGQSDCVVAV